MYSFENKNLKAILISENDVNITKEMYGDGNVSESDSCEELFSNLKIKPKKFYAVKTGRIKGIFFDWNICQPQISGFPNATYKSFLMLHDAINFLSIENELNKKEIKSKDNPEHKGVFAYVDGSFNAKTGIYGYGVVLDVNGQRYQFKGNGNDKDMASMRNVAGEILGSTRAIQEAIQLGINEISIYYDYQGIAAWASGDWKRNKVGTQKYYDFIQSAKNKIKINFIKVKAHTGVELNEVVDKLAKEAVGIID